MMAGTGGGSGVRRDVLFAFFYLAKAVKKRVGSQRPILERASAIKIIILMRPIKNKAEMARQTTATSRPSVRRTPNDAETMPITLRARTVVTLSACRFRVPCHMRRAMMENALVQSAAITLGMFGRLFQFAFKIRHYGSMATLSAR
jgi:hypothetical protein